MASAKLASSLRKHDGCPDSVKQRTLRLAAEHIGVERNVVAEFKLFVGLLPIEMSKLLAYRVEVSENPTVPNKSIAC
jgi:hypothetical protein